MIHMFVLYSYFWSQISYQIIWNFITNVLQCSQIWAKSVKHVDEKSIKQIFSLFIFILQVSTCNVKIVVDIWDPWTC